MLPSKLFRSGLVWAISIPLLASCADKAPQKPAVSLPATASVELTLDESRIPGNCNVFAHLIISIPAKKPIGEVTKGVKRYGMEHGADFILVGLTRESGDESESLMFQTYGPEAPYSFKNRWLGWKFGFSDWNSGGPLVDYGHDRMTGDMDPLFDIPVDAQAVLLTCPQK